jgi:uncharacterized membrane protein YphA (DoxX/SURF4 family)
MGRKKNKKARNSGATAARISGANAARKPAAAGAAPRSSFANKHADTLRRVGRGAAILLGLVFLLAGTLKIGDPWSFLGSLPAYGVPSAVRLPATVLVPIFEVVLGFMLVAGWRLREASMATAAFLLVFGGAIAYGWAAGTLQECGCFGPLLKRTPPQALAQDAGLMLLAVLGFLWAPASNKSMTRGRWGTLATIAIASVAMIGSTLMEDPGTLEERIAAAEPVVGGATPSLADLNLRDRDVFLYLFHPDCPHCIENSPRVKRIVDDPDLPELIGITHSVRPADVRNYQLGADAEFIAYTFLMPSFVQITGDGAVPQLVYLRRGRIERVWKGDLPSPAELKRFLSAG